MIHFSMSLDEIEKNAGVAIYGTGSSGQGFYQMLSLFRPDIRIVCFLDSFKEDLSSSPPVWNINTVNPSQLEIDIILICSAYHADIIERLCEVGFIPHDTVQIFNMDWGTTPPNRLASQETHCESICRLMPINVSNESVLFKSQLEDLKYNLAFEKKAQKAQKVHLLIREGNLKKAAEILKKTFPKDIKQTPYCDLSMDDCNYGIINLKQESGYRDQYNHYFGSVVLPLIELMHTSVLDSSKVYLMTGNGPFDDETIFLAKKIGINIVILNMDVFGGIDLKTSSPLVESITLHAYDFYWNGDGLYTLANHYKYIKENAKQIFNLNFEKYSASPKILLVLRGDSLDYYPEKNRTSASMRRSVENGGALADEILKRFPNASVVKFEQIKIDEKAILCNQADIMIAQHGAALMNLIFMREEAHLIEILPDVVKYPSRRAGRIMCDLNNITYTYVSQPYNKGSVNISQLIRILEDAISIHEMKRNEKK